MLQKLRAPNSTRTHLFPRTPSFFHYSTDDLLLGTLSYCSTYDYEQQTSYLINPAVARAKEMAREMEQCSKDTIQNHYRVLLKRGFILEQPRVELPTRYEMFSILHDETLQLLLQYARPNVIKLYTHLLTQYIFKRSSKHLYYFTTKDIATLFGYKNPYAKKVAIEQLLLSLVKQGFIRLRRTYLEGGGIITTGYVLLEVAQTQEEKERLANIPISVQLLNSEIIKALPKTPCIFIDIFQNKYYCARGEMNSFENDEILLDEFHDYQDI